MAELPIPNLDEIPTPSAPTETTKPTVETPAQSSLPKLPVIPMPSLKPPKLPTFERPTIRLPRIPWKAVLLIVGILLVVSITVFFLFFWKATVTLTSTPVDAQIQLANQTATGSLNTKLKPGTYQLSVERQDFIPFKSSVTLKIHDKHIANIALRALPNPITLSDQLIQFMALDAERTSLLYLAPSQHTAYRLFIKDLAKPVTDEITPANLNGITDFIWAPSRQLAFMKLNDVTKQYDFKRYDLVNQETHDWPAGVGSIDWRPDSEKVAYDFEPAGGEKTIIRATKDNSEQERIFNLVGTTIEHPKLKWSPDSKFVSLVTTQLHILDVFSKQLTPTAFDKLPPIKDALWLPTSTGLIVQAQDDSLSLVKLDGTQTNLGVLGQLNQVVPFKDGTALVYTRERNSKTEFFRINLSDQSLTPYLFKTQAPLAPTNLVLSADEQTLFFISAGHPSALHLDTGTY